MADVPADGYNTPKKVSKLRQACRKTLIETPPPVKKIRYDKEFYENFSASFHGLALDQEIKIDKNEHPSAQRLTEKDIANALVFGGPGKGCLNILPDLSTRPHITRNFFDLRYKNGAGRKEAYVGGKHGFVDSEGFHRFPEHCPFMHCSTLPTQLKFLTTPEKSSSSRQFNLSSNMVIPNVNSTPYKQSKDKNCSQITLASPSLELM